MTHDRAAILAIGDEIVLGQKHNTNSAWLADRLAGLGVMTVEHAEVADDRAAIARAIARLAEAAPLVLCTGGLGPTADDLTREGLGDAMGEAVAEDGAAAAMVEASLRRRGRTMTEAHRVQATLPRTARALANEVGVAPGLWARVRTGSGREADVVCLPGPPSEMRPMFEAEVAGRIRRPVGEAISTRVLHLCGLVESDTATRLAAILARDRNPTVGITVGRAIVSLRIRHRGEPSGAGAALDETERAIREVLGPLIFGEGERTLAESVLELLLARGETIVTAESCTGGGLGALLSDVPGSSAALLGGWITYSNEMKSRELHVPRELLERVGAVSEPVARAMSEDALVGADADHALAVTGVAGPGGGTPEKPVGTVFVARSSRAGASVETEVRRFLFPGDRAAVRERSALMALVMLRLHLIGASRTTLSWEQQPAR